MGVEIFFKDLIHFHYTAFLAPPKDLASFPNGHEFQNLCGGLRGLHNNIIHLVLLKYLIFYLWE